MAKWLAKISGFFLVVLFIFYLFTVCRFTVMKAEIVLRSERKLVQALELNRMHIRQFYKIYHEYPILKSKNLEFWDYRTNQYVWLRTFDGIANLATNPVGVEQRENTWQFWNEKQGKMTPPNEEKIREFFNPLTGKFDWLAEDASGTLYSPDMPDSVLIASPPIRVVNIRCPLTASDPPFYEDFTKW